jgi:methyltransferase family protein
MIEHSNVTPTAGSDAASDRASDPGFDAALTPTTLADLLADPPLVHHGGTCTWRLASTVLDFIDDRVRPDSHTLETGAGISTLLFALRGCHHTCVVPLEDEVDRLRDYCAARKIPLRNVNFKVERSETALPRMDLEPLDLILIDGNHAFPAPFIDWFYTARFLKEGGFLIIDDTNLWTGDLLRRFLKSEKGEWKQLDTFAGRAAAFQKTGKGSETKGWEEQPLVVKTSRRLTLQHKLRVALGLARQGRFPTIIQRVFRRES